jgi:hypothetical protein
MKVALTLTIVSMALILIQGKTMDTDSYKDVGGNVDIEYYLEVSEDSIWVESVHTKKVYSGKYSDLETIINKDNL